MTGATERDCARLLEDGLRIAHIAYYHTQDSRGSAEGFPDYVIATPRLMFAELKADGGRVTPAQAEWFALLGRADEDVFLAVGVDGAAQLLRLAILADGHRVRALRLTSMPPPMSRAQVPPTETTGPGGPVVFVLGDGRVYLPADDPAGGLTYRRGEVLQSR